VSRKVFTQVSVLILFLLAFLGTPASVQAGGVCGGTYIVQPGDTLGGIASYCGTTIPAIYAANPGISAYLYAGQVLVIPGGDYCNCPPVHYTNTYIVQYGDTFSEIASRFGVSTYDLWAANPYIWDINLLYAGQVLYVPASSWVVPAPIWPQPAPTQPVTDSSWFKIVDTSTETETPPPLSYGTAPSGTPKGKVGLIKKTRADVYISLQGTTRDGSSVINEYPVSGTMNVKVPVGWYTYVAWVGGQKHSGQFNLGGSSDRSITFYSNKVVVE
jgi:LysM repeat protein